jgi:hypothetical protein
MIYEEALNLNLNFNLASTPTSMKKNILLLQTVYYLLTAIWALVDIHSFMKVTGPKTDIWLVKTVAVLLLAIGFSYLAALIQENISAPVLVLAIATPVMLIGIDVYYSLNGTISKIYLADAVAELLLVIIWVIAWKREKGKGESKKSKVKSKKTGR